MERIMKNILILLIAFSEVLLWATQAWPGISG
jgi:hypothetical protein